MELHGDCDPRFQAVRAEFERNFRERGEVGAAVCVLVDGRSVVDLWGGVADRRTQRPWQRDTLGLVWSCTKGAVALCAHILVSRGQLDLDALVARYWPEFAQAGKEAITTRLLLSHQAGLPTVRQPLQPGGLFDWQYVTETLAAAAPFWEPGTRQGYHALTFGHLVGEVVRRVAGQPLDVFFRDEIAGPLSLDFHLGLPEADEPRVAPTIKPDLTPPGETPWRFVARMAEDPQSLQALTMRNTGLRPGELESRAAAPRCCRARAASATPAVWPGCTRRWPWAAQSTASAWWTRTRWRRWPQSIPPVRSMRCCWWACALRWAT